MPKWSIPADAEVYLTFASPVEGVNAETYCGGVLSIEAEGGVVVVRTNNSTVTYDPDIIAEVSVRWYL